MTESRSNLGKIRELFVFGLVGISNTIVDIGVTMSLSWLLSATSGFLLGFVNVIGFSTAVVNSYFLNKYWTFKNTTQTSQKEFVKFFLISIGGLVINTLVVIVSEMTLQPVLASPQLRVLSGKIIATAFTLVWNYGGYKLFVFK